jgi:hypothetical protein
MKMPLVQRHSYQVCEVLERERGRAIAPKTGRINRATGDSQNSPSHEQRVIVIVSALLSFLITAPIQYGFFL